MQLLEGTTSPFVGLVLLLLVSSMSLFMRDRQLKVDLRGAVIFLSTWLALWVVDFAMVHLNIHGFEKLVRVLWMLALAFGIVRAVVAMFLWGYRRLKLEETPKILRDVLDFVLYALAALPILKTQLDIDLTSLLATSAIVSVVLGLALQETLGNLFAGLSLQMERPFRAGDWIAVGEHVGRVVQTAWRATRIETARLEEITLPNSHIAKAALKNHTRGGLPVGIDLEVSVSYATAPNVVREEVQNALLEIPEILKDPAPVCRIRQFGDSGIAYLVRFFIGEFGDAPSAQNEAYTRLWYRFAREGIEIPYPQRVVHTRSTETMRAPNHLALVSKLELFEPFTAEQRGEIARSAKERQFGRGETLIREGEPGQSFYVLAEGEVAVAHGGSEIARLKRGAYFGEMSLLTGAPRSATVVATTDVQVLELDRDVFQRHFAADPNRAREMSELLAKRRVELDSVPAPNRAEASADIAPEIFRRLRNIFRLPSGG